MASYVEKLMRTDEPVNIARALTVAGFSVESEFAEIAFRDLKRRRVLLERCTVRQRVRMIAIDGQNIGTNVCALLPLK